MKTFPSRPVRFHAAGADDYVSTDAPQPDDGAQPPNGDGDWSAVMAEPTPGWAVASDGGEIVAADARFRSLLGVPAEEPTVGRGWIDLVSARSGAALLSALRALAEQRHWGGALELLAEGRARMLRMDLYPVTGADGGVIVLRAVDLPEYSAGVDPGIRLAILEAAVEVREPSAVARAALQELRHAVPFDWAVVLRFERDEAEVVAAYPSGMAGMQPGVRFAPDLYERLLQENGEPSLTGNLAHEHGARSPLGRLPSFGLRSAIRLPLFAGNVVVGCINLYSKAAEGFTPGHGMALEEYVRPLGPRLVEGQPSAAGSAAASSAAGSSAGGAAAGTEPAPGASAEPRAEEPVASPAAGGRSLEAHGLDRLNQLGSLVSGVAHELNNPLTAILGYTQMLPSLSGQDATNAIRTIEQEAIRAGRIVRNLLYFARQHRPRVEEVDLNALLTRVIEVRRYHFAVDDVEIQAELGSLPTLRGDQYQLEQVFLNILNNAHQALRPEGGVITVRSETVGERARVTVADTGPGIPEDLQLRIFEPFFTTREVGEGPGLGLSIAYGIVQEHGGRLWAERGEQGGARLIVELPLPDGAPGGTPLGNIPSAPPRSTPGPGPSPQPAQTAPVQTAPVQTAPPQTAPPRPATERREQRVLVVDDEEPIRALLHEILDAAGYAVTVVASAELALHLLREREFDVIVCDVRMPGLTGYEFYEQVLETWPRLAEHCLFISGDIERDRLQRPEHAGEAHFLEKPFTRDELLNAVELAAGVPERVSPPDAP